MTGAGPRSRSPFPQSAPLAFPDERPTVTECPKCDGTGREGIAGPYRLDCKLCRGHRMVPAPVRSAWLALRKWTEE